MPCPIHLSEDEDAKFRMNENNIHGRAVCLLFYGDDSDDDMYCYYSGSSSSSSSSSSRRSGSGEGGGGGGGGGVLKAVTASVAGAVAGAAAAAVAAAGGDAIVVRAAIVILVLRQSLTPEGKVVASGKFQTFVDPNSEQQTIASPVCRNCTHGFRDPLGLSILSGSIRTVKTIRIMQSLRGNGPLVLAFGLGQCERAALLWTGGFPPYPFRASLASAPLMNTLLREPGRPSTLAVWRSRRS